MWDRLLACHAAFRTMSHAKHVCDRRQGTYATFTNYYHGATITELMTSGEVHLPFFFLGVAVEAGS